MICLIDIGHNFWRNWYATKSPSDAYELTVDDVLKCKDDYERVAVCCDSHSKRHEYYPEYKANREPKPEEALDSLRAMEEQVTSWSIPVLRCDGFEADDVIATLAGQAVFDDVRIHTTDKDLYQLIRPTVRLVTKRGEVSEAGCIEKFGVRPDQMRDWLALVGDTADNIPGCPQVGPGRARDLLCKFGTLEAIKAATADELSTVNKVGDKTIAAIQAWDPSLAVRLVTLLTDAPVELEKLWRTA